MRTFYRGSTRFKNLTTVHKDSIFYCHRERILLHERLDKGFETFKKYAPAPSFLRGLLSYEDHGSVLNMDEIFLLQGVDDRFDAVTIG